MPTPPHVPTDEKRRIARELSGLGVPQDSICHILGISKNTLHAHYRADLDLGMAEANAKVSGSLFKLIEQGNVAATIFWLKSRCGWSEKVQTEQVGEIKVSWVSEGARAEVKSTDEDK